MGSVDHIQYLFKRYFLLGYCGHILYHGKSKIQIFNFGLSHRPCRGSEVTVGSEDPLQIFERVYLFKRGQVEHILTMANLQLKPSPFTPRPTAHSHCSSLLCLIFSDSSNCSKHAQLDVASSLKLMHTIIKILF